MNSKRRQVRVNKRSKTLCALTMILSVGTLSCTTVQPRFQVPPHHPKRELAADERDEIIQACDKALTDCQAANSDKQAVINQQDRIIVDQQHQLDECKQDQSSLWSRPWYTITLGVVATLLLLIVSGHTR